MTAAIKTNMNTTAQKVQEIYYEKHPELAHPDETLLALCAMWTQYCHDGHSFMSAGEAAETALEQRVSIDGINGDIKYSDKDLYPDITTLQALSLLEDCAIAYTGDIIKIADDVVQPEHFHGATRASYEELGVQVDPTIALFRDQSQETQDKILELIKN